MAISNKQIGWSQESNLLWEISKQMDRLTKVTSQSGGGGSTALQYETAYVSVDGNDSTAELGNIDKPYLTIDGALNNNSGVEFLLIDIGLGSFQSPSEASLRDNLILKGKGKPDFNYEVQVDSYDVINITEPTHLVGGTILYGPILCIAKNNVQWYDLGVDCGSDWADTYNAGQPSAAGALLIAQLYNDPTSPDGYHPPQTQSPPNTNCILKNISVLAMAGSYHTVLLESQLYPIVDNLTSMHGVWNLVVKSIGGNFTNLTLVGSSDAGLYCKSSYYAYFKNSNFFNVNISSFDGNQSGCGIQIGGENYIDTFSGLTLSNFNINRTNGGIKCYNPTGSTEIKYINISNGLIQNCSGIAIDSNDCPLLYSNFENLILQNNNTDVRIISGDYNNLTNIRSIECVNNAFELDASTAIYANNVIAITCGGTDYTYTDKVVTVNEFRNTHYNFNNLPAYTDNSDAISNGLNVGDIYRNESTADGLNIVHS